MSRLDSEANETGRNLLIIGRFASEEDACTVEHLINDLVELASEDGDEVVPSKESQAFIRDLGRLLPMSPHMPEVLFYLDMRRRDKTITLETREEQGRFFAAAMRWKGAEIETHSFAHEAAGVGAG